MAEEIETIVGTGITKRTDKRLRYRADDPEFCAAIDKWGDAHNRSLVTPLGIYASQIAAVRAALAQEERAAPSAYDDIEGYNAHFCERSTNAWYFKMIDVSATIAEMAIDEGRPWEAFSHAVQIGEYLTELRLKRKWEPAAIAGKGSLEGSRKGADARKESFRLRHEAIAQDYADCRTRVDRPVALAAVAKRNNLSIRQVRRIVPKE